jgi:hypothetical protein
MLRERKNKEPHIRDGRETYSAGPAQQAHHRKQWLASFSLKLLFYDKMLPLKNTLPEKFYIIWLKKSLVYTKTVS